MNDQHNSDNINLINKQDSSRFLAAIQLQETEAEHLDRAFLVTPQYVPWPKAYGGDSVAQAAAAAIATIGDDRTLHSLHSAFLRPVEISTPVRYEVELLRDGRGYSTRHVRGYQHGKAVFMCTASFQVPETGPILGPNMPEVPAPEELPSSAEYLAANPSGRDEADDYWAHGRSFDIRHIPGPLYTRIDGLEAEHRGVWVRAFTALPDEPRVHQLAVSYVCDYTILEPSLRDLGTHWSAPGLVTASLDHAMWFHQPARADEWLLYLQESAGVQSGRGLNLGRFFARDGVLVATVMQEGLLRQG
ncbi:thioesterase family protein [Leucobacter sp. UT-8R-CII-1-4]|uniref:acyl-CoA thioesterase n=1 Tax=Leucobacter sp. UT-8R-CII-1-4 TaxID=3040075 RepID=UPI0024A8BB68|nr:acyl-CoA thioesterase domain-containing protein [Leucobacter sp. UT-8R-CII-1-4]MDI6023490.1 thioesterase family protein [Leucobacter sp. UT-8R-CII-1-4]